MEQADTDGEPSCAGCGQALRPDERVLIEVDNGGLKIGTLADLDDTPVRVWHARCLGG